MPVIDETPDQIVTPTDRPTDEALKRPKRPTVPAPSKSSNLVDIIEGLSDAAETDPIAQGFLAQIQSRNPSDKQWFDRLKTFYRVQLRTTELADKLRAAVGRRRAERTNPRPRPGSSDREQTDALLAHSGLLLLHWDLYVLMMREGYRWLSGESDVEQQTRESLQAIYSYAPFRPESDTWLTELLAPPEPGHELASILRARDMPNMPGGPEVWERWHQFLANCRCESDDEPDEGCRVHALVQACRRYSQHALAVLMHQLAAPNASADDLHYDPQQDETPPGE